MLFFMFPFVAFGALMAAGVLFPRLNDDYTIAAWGMGIAFGIAPICIVVALLLGVWHLWRGWTGAGEPRIGLGRSAFLDEPFHSSRALRWPDTRGCNYPPSSTLAARDHWPARRKRSPSTTPDWAARTAASGTRLAPAACARAAALPTRLADRRETIVSGLLFRPSSPAARRAAGSPSVVCREPAPSASCADPRCGRASADGLGWPVIFRTAC